MTPSAKKIHFVSLGCPKNLVDGEVMQGSLVSRGHQLVLDPTEADVLVVNTCSFIDEAKEESIDTILDLARFKRPDSSRRLVVTGCLAERFGADLRESLPEVDVFVGTGDFLQLPDVVEERAKNALYVGSQHVLPAGDAPRLQSTPFYTSFLKIAEGCDRTCAFCIIPKIRGRQESRGVASLVEEARRLAGSGVVELCLIAQDLTNYGRDRDDGANLERLLEALARIDGLRWIRLLYLYPQHLTDGLLGVIAREPTICSYLDMPLQHASDRMLRAMRRGRTGDALRDLVARVRGRVPGVVLRSSFIVGYPGETDADFAELMSFVEELRFERVGVFRYSREEGTAAAELALQVPEKVKEFRRRRLMGLQAKISRELHRAQVGSEVEVLVCGVDDSGRAWGRTAGQAADIDGIVTLEGAEIPDVGEFVRAQVVRSTTYDLEARLRDTSERATRPARARAGRTSRRVDGVNRANPTPAR